MDGSLAATLPVLEMLIGATLYLVNSHSGKCEYTWVQNDCYGQPFTVVNAKWLFNMYLEWCVFSCTSIVALTIRESIKVVVLTPGAHSYATIWPV